MKPLRIKFQRFLLDENVRSELVSFLKSSGSNVVRVSKSASDLQVATISFKEKRILVTSDEDFSEYSKEQLFSLVLLKLPQNEPDLLIESFTNLLMGIPVFKGIKVVLSKEGFEKSTLRKAG